MRSEFVSCWESFFFQEILVHVLTLYQKQSKLCNYLFLIVTFKANEHSRIYLLTVVQILEFWHFQHPKSNLKEEK